MALSAIANKFPDILNQHVNELAGYIFFALKSSNSAIIRNACGVVSDLCTLTESPEIVVGFAEYMPILLDHLKDTNTDRSAKVIIISLIGDTFLLTKEKFVPFLEQSLEILDSAAAQSIIVPEDYIERTDLMEHLALLHSALIECFTCFVQNIESS